MYYIEDENYYDEQFLPMYKMYIKSRSNCIAKHIKNCIIKKLEIDNKHVYLEWFTTVYLNEKWENFHHISVKIPGIKPTQQPIEACNHGIKFVLNKNANITDMVHIGKYIQFDMIHIINVILYVGRYTEAFDIFI